MSLQYLLSLPFYVQLALAVAGLVILIPVIKYIAWKLFKFDKRVEKILEQKKSSEVRLGKISETLSPFLDGFPVDVEKIGTSTGFLGQPVDYVHFDPDNGITFIEVKSGNSRLSASQKKIKELVLQGKVFWKEFSVK